MHIAHVIPRGVHAYSGLLPASVGLASAVQELGHVVELYGFDCGPGSELESIVRHAGGREVPLHELPQPLGQLALGKKLAQRINTSFSRADLVHMHGVFGPTNNLIARRLTNPYVVSPHGGFAIQAMQYHRLRKRLFLPVLEKPMLRASSAVCALSDQEVAEVRRLGYAGPIAVVPNGVDTGPTGLNVIALRNELDLPADAMLAIYSGRFDVRHKRLDALVKGLEDPRWHLALMGGDFRGGAIEVRQLAEKAGVAARVHFPPPRRGRELAEALGSADAFVLISRWEGMSMALLEAAAVGVPAIVSSEVEATTRIVASGGGLITSPENLASALDQVAAASSQERAGWSDAAQRYAAQFSWDAVGRKMVRVYEQVLAGG